MLTIPLFHKAALFSALLFLSGCAATQEKKVNHIIPDGYQARYIKFKDAAGEGLIFEPVFKSRLDILKETAAFKNNRLTAEIAAGTAAAIASYSAIGSYFRVKDITPNYLASLAAAACSAYAAAALAGAVYDMLVPGPKRH